MNEERKTWFFQLWTKFHFFKILISSWSIVRYLMFSSDFKILAFIPTKQNHWQWQFILILFLKPSHLLFLLSFSLQLPIKLLWLGWNFYEAPNNRSEYVAPKSFTVEKAKWVFLSSWLSGFSILSWGFWISSLKLWELNLGLKHYITGEPISCL